MRSISASEGCGSVAYSKDNLVKGWQPTAGGQAFKNHLDGDNLLPFLEGTQAKSPRTEFFKAESLRYCERVFAVDLCGEPLLSNKSTWFNYAIVRSRRWHQRQCRAAR